MPESWGLARPARLRVAADGSAPTGAHTLRNTTGPLTAVNTAMRRPRKMCGLAIRQPAGAEVDMDAPIRQKILDLLDSHRIMTIATLRPDGWPQATTVGYVNEGLTLWFLCGLESQKARNLAADDRVSITIDHDTADLMAITGLSMAARARRVTDRDEALKVLRLLPQKYADAPPPATTLTMPGPDDVALFRVVPELNSVLDYTQGFAHTDLVKVAPSET